MACKERAVIDFLLDELRHHRSDPSNHGRPLIVGLQGPQGSDLYLPHDAMQNVGRENASNGLLQGRGQPGTHDVALGTSLLHAIRDLNTQTEGALALPVYDKSAFDGQGDRAARTIQVCAPIDIVLFEGWCLGFYSIPRAVLAERIATASQNDPPAFLSYSLEHLDAVNEQLRVWEQQWYPLIDAFVQFCPHATDGASPWSLVYPWRLQAEHAMKKANGGKGMSDAQVYSFVQRYLPSYELFCQDLRQPNPWTGRCLCMDVGADREASSIQRV
ncbi:glycerate 3-kinase [Malassezia japonica]|uniref:Glycerate 3-kinase n=1 Tax=Malassezia japonica TaxID=223818 RepID=A0AAF0J8W3_9BASI|nr:glycerate 3-kinase [Malassezia japonica]WFD37515.1 glycerate 3-kinase [Malassezia japonica]